jgi:hypothetical protein
MSYACKLMMLVDTGCMFFDNYCNVDTSLDALFETYSLDAGSLNTQQQSNRNRSPPPLPQLPDIPVLMPTPAPLPSSRFDGLLGASNSATVPAANVATSRTQQTRPRDAGLFGEQQQQSQQSDAQQVQGDAKRSSDASRKGGNRGSSGLFG